MTTVQSHTRDLDSWNMATDLSRGQWGHGEELRGERDSGVWTSNRIQTKGLFGLMYLPVELRLKVGTPVFLDFDSQ